MDLTLGQICSLATSLIQGRTDITLSTASLWANLAYQEVATRIQYATDEGIAISSTTSGENRITLPADFGYPISVSNLSMTGDKATLRKRDADTFDSQSTALACPEEYALYADWMELYPSPDSSYSVKLRYGKKMPVMVASTSTPAFDSRYHLPIVFRTAALLAATVDDLDREATNQARYLSTISSTPTDHALRQRDKQSMRVSMEWRHQG
jgi:hypothetical protein